MYYNRYIAPSGDKYDGCGEFNTIAEAEACAREAVANSLPGTIYAGTSLLKFKEQRHAA